METWQILSDDKAPPVIVAEPLGRKSMYSPAKSLIETEVGAAAAVDAENDMVFTTEPFLYSLLNTVVPVLERYPCTL